jgi:DNA-binding Lrp family transcriptional regulator
MSSLDAYDRRLLELVQRDGSLSQSELGERVHRRPPPSIAG